MPATKQLIVCFKPGTRKSRCLKIHKERKAELIKEIKEIGIHVVTIPDGELPSCLKGYTDSKDVRFVEEDYFIQVEPIINTIGISSLKKITTSSVTTNDPLLERQWGLDNINAQGAWDLARVAPLSAKIAILDTGVKGNHPDLRGKIIHQANFSSSPTADDIHGHGTHVAGVAAAATNNRNGIAGMSYNTGAIMNIKVMGDNGGGSISNVAQGIIHAANQGAHIINLSLGAAMGNETLRNAVNYAHNRGALLIAAAGNNSSNIAHYPAGYNQVLAVAATNQSNELAPFSNYGSWVEVAAPGQDILSTFPGEAGDSMYRTASGTSQAAPFVSGLAGLIKATNQTLTNRQIRSIIHRSAIRPVSGGSIRFGRIDARRAIQLAMNAAGGNHLQSNNAPQAWLNLD